MSKSSISRLFTGCEVFTVPELAAILNVSPSSVRSWIHSGQLPAFDAGRTYRLTGADVNAFMAQHTGKRSRDRRKRKPRHDDMVAAYSPSRKR